METPKEKYDDVSFGILSIVSPLTSKGELLVVPSVTRFELNEFDRGPYNIVALPSKKITLTSKSNPILEEVLNRVSLENFKKLKSPRSDSFNYSPFGVPYSLSEELKEEIIFSGFGALRFNRIIKINPAVWDHYMVGSTEGEGATIHKGISGRIGGHFTSQPTSRY